MRQVLIWMAAVIFSMAQGSCGGQQARQKDQPEPVAIAPQGQNPVAAEENVTDKVMMRLREIPFEGEMVDMPVAAKAERLSPKRTSALFAGLGPLSSDYSVQPTFAFRTTSKPPPRTGATVTHPFPSLEETAPPPEADKPGELTVLRYAPEGKVDLAPHLSVTFSQPMVAVTRQEEAAKSVPLSLTPTPKGRWRWLGARTLMFDPEGRFPMATDYQVTIPAGTRSLSGDKLAKAHTFSFGTPPLEIVDSFPKGDAPQELTPTIVIRFNQRVDRKALLPSIHLESGKERFPVVIAEEKAVESARNEPPPLFYALQEADPATVITLKPMRPLPKGRMFEVVVDKGAPSAEGPKRTQAKHTFLFRTFDPLAVTDRSCGWNDQCRPTDEWVISFNNPLDTEAFDPARVRIEPAIVSPTITAWDRTIRIRGQITGRTQYQVTLPSELRDSFGQRLGSAKSVTFEIGPSDQGLFGPDRQIVTLDPYGPKALSIRTINHDVLKMEIQRVVPADFRKLGESFRKWQERPRLAPMPLPGKRLYDGRLKTKGPPDALHETLIDLTPYLENGFGQLLVRITLPQPYTNGSRYGAEVLVWVQVTGLGITAFADQEELLAWITGLKDGAPLAGVKVSLLGPGGAAMRGTSDQSGLIRFQLPTGEKAPDILVVAQGADTAILPRADDVRWASGGWRASTAPDQVRWYTFDDQGIYRPGDTARIKGWLRRFGAGKRGDIGALAPLPSKVVWQLIGARGDALRKGEAKLSRLGGFHIEAPLPKNADLGSAYLKITPVGGGVIDAEEHYHPLQVQAFRRPEFEVRAAAAPGLYLLGDEAQVSLTAAYYAGGGLSLAPVEWQVTATPGQFVPPGLAAYQFGSSHPWWRGLEPSGEVVHETLSGKTDGAGMHRLGIRFEAISPPHPMSLRAEGRVTDLNHQTWTASTALLVHPASLYVGVKTGLGFVHRDQTVPVDVVIANPAGHLVPNQKARLTLSRLESVYQKGAWRENPIDEDACEVTSAEEPSSCAFTPKMGGQYRIRATVHDDRGRRNETDVVLWVAGEAGTTPRGVEEEALTLVPEKEAYQPGETASLMVASPFYPATGIMTVQRSGLLTTETFKMEGPTHVLEVPILEAHIPNVTVRVDVVGAAPRSDANGEVQKDVPPRPAFASAELTFKVPPFTRTLAVTASPREKMLRPGGTTSIDIVVKDAMGRPAGGAELAVIVADESVLALTGYRLPDPIEIFYEARYGGVMAYHSRSGIALSDMVVPGVATRRTALRGGLISDKAMPPAAPSPSRAMALGRGEMAAATADGDPDMDEEGAGMPGGPAGPMALRTNFNAVALFAPEVTTDQKGRATVPLNLPDSLTRYRIMVVAVAGDKMFGTAESDLTAALPLMARISPPRFLNFGDRFDMPVVLENQTDKPMVVELAFRADNATLADTLDTAVPGSAIVGLSSLGRKVTVPPRNRVAVRFPTASRQVGTAKFQLAVATEGFADAQAFDLKVLTPATTEAFATYGEVDGGSNALAVSAPRDVWPELGGLEITTSATQLQSLTDAVLYLVQYPYDCAEQRASRLLAVAALRDVLAAFDAKELPSPEAIATSVSDDIKALEKTQRYDGGFGFWPEGENAYPYLTVHVAHALAMAKSKGYAVPAEMWQRVSSYLEQINEMIPASYSKESGWAIRAYAAYVQAKMGLKPSDKAEKLIAEAGLDNLSLEALGWLLPCLKPGGKALIARVLQRLDNSVTETAAGAHFITGYDDGAEVLLHSERRVDAILLDALIAVSPKNDLIPKLARGLLGQRTKGRWESTQENAFVILALDRYFEAFEKQTPDFTARVWLGNALALTHPFKGRTTDRAQVTVPMAYVTSKPLVVEKAGEGRLYYRVGLSYAPKALALAAADYGFALTRAYEAVDDPADVARDAKGIWHIRAGARVRIRVTMATPMRRYHVALSDPLPAGLEAINPELAVTESLPDDPSANPLPYWWWHRPWFEHQNLRDEQVEAFTSLLWDGVHEYTYVARATTAGIFIVPPTHAEEMYHPETFGRTASDRVEVTLVR